MNKTDVLCAWGCVLIVVVSIVSYKLGTLANPNLQPQEAQYEACARGVVYYTQGRFSNVPHVPARTIDDKLIPCETNTNEKETP